MRTENDLRAAFRTLAAEAPDTESVLDHRSGNGAKRGRPRLVAPITAAAAVIAIAVASVVLTAGAGGLSGPAPSAAGNALPRYYVATAATVADGSPTVRDTRTGAVLATVRMPVDYAAVVAAAAASDHSFVLAAIGDAGPTRLFLLRFDPATRQTSLTRLPIAGMPQQDFSGLAVSPAGTQIAVALSGSKHSELRIYSLTGRVVRRWQGAGQIGLLGVPCLSWAANGTLAFNWVDRGIFLLHAAAASGPLSAVARLVVPGSRIGSLALSQNGSKIAAVVWHPDRPGSTSGFLEFEEFSVASGKLISRPAGKRHFGLFVIWSNASGSSLIVRVHEEGPAPVGVLAGGRFVPLRGLPAMGVSVVGF